MFRGCQLLLSQQWVYSPRSSALQFQANVKAATSRGYCYYILMHPIRIATSTGTEHFLPHSTRQAESIRVLGGGRLGKRWGSERTPAIDRDNFRRVFSANLM